MDKKGFFIQFITDAYGMLIFAIGMLFWAAIFVFFKPQITFEIAEETPYISNDALLLTYLRTPIDDTKNLADLITETYFGTPPDQLTLKLNQILNSAYRRGEAKPVCWRLWYYDPPESEAEKVLAKEECTGEKRELLDATTTIPLQNKKPIRLRLIVPGYKG